jgi:hypothetical protein
MRGFCPFMSTDKKVECSTECSLFIQKESLYTLGSKIESDCTFKLQLHKLFQIQQKVNLLNIDSNTGSLKVDSN